MKAFTRFALLLVALLAITYLLLSMGFRSAEERRALLISAWLAGTVQMLGFILIQMLGRGNALIGWAMGIILRGTVLVAYGLLAARTLGLPLTAALVGFAVFLFVSMLLESILLAYAS